MSDNKLAQFEAAETAWLDVMDITGDEPLMFFEKPVRIEMYGPGSDVYAKAQAKIDRHRQDSAMNAALRGGKAKKGEDETSTMKKLVTEKMIACTKTIENFPATAEELHTNRRIGWVSSQCTVFMEGWANFLPKSEKS